MLKTDLKTIQRNGIRFLQTNYNHDKLYGLKERVLIRYSLFDLTKVKVYSDKGEFICEAKRVEKTHPMAYHMGTIKDMEDFKQKIQKQQKIRNKTLRAVKKYLPADDIKFLKMQMQEELIEVNNNEIIEVKPIRKEAVPFFLNNYEKYDWLMKKGCTSSDERVWVEKYKKSNEYKEIYE
jgi:hypothetical protein